MSQNEYPFSLEKLVRRISVVAQAEAGSAVPVLTSQSPSKNSPTTTNPRDTTGTFHSSKTLSRSESRSSTSDSGLPEEELNYKMSDDILKSYPDNNSSQAQPLDDASLAGLTNEEIRSSIFNNMSMVSPVITPGGSPRSESLRGSEIDLTHSVSSFSSATSLSADSPNHSHPSTLHSDEEKAKNRDSTIQEGEEEGSVSEAQRHLNEGRLNNGSHDHDHHHEHHKHRHHKDPTLQKGHDKSLVKQSLLEELPEVFCESRARIPTTNGTEIFLHLYRNNIDSKEHLAIVFGQDIYSKTLFQVREGETEQDRMTRGAYVGRLYPGRQRSDEDAVPSTNSPVETSNRDTLVRIHSECYTGETAWSARCDCGEQLDEAARLMSQEGRGVIVYLRQEGRGIGLGEKLKAYNLQDLGADTVTANLMLRHPADARSFGLATAILLDLGLTRVSLLTNNPDKIVAVEGKDKLIKVTKRVPMIPLSWQNKGGFKSKEVDQYLRTKVERMGHMLDLEQS